MKRICPKQVAWDRAFQRLVAFAQSQKCVPLAPPIPLILGGWAGSSDLEKMARWQETLAWAAQNGCSKILADIPDTAFYCKEYPSSQVIGLPGGRGLHPSESAPVKPLGSELVAFLLHKLMSDWPVIAGKELAEITLPIALKGSKARRLVVFADKTVVPPWGSWDYQKANHQSFTDFRAAINRSIAPHEIDHIDFTSYSRRARLKPSPPAK